MRNRQETVLALHLGDTGTHALADRRRAREELFLRHDVENREGRHAGNRRSRIGPAHPARLDGIHQRRTADDAG